MTRLVVSGTGEKKSVAEAASRLLPFIEKYAEITAKDLDATLDLEKCDAEMVVVLGGDGSILGAARRMGRRQVPVLGVNFGKFGFLALFSEKSFKREFPEMVKGEINVSRRLLLLSKHIRDGSVIHEMPAANDVVISRTMPRLIDVRLYVDGSPLTTYSGDGVIVSTPTGSTAYSLSAGGPILEPGIESYLVAPICGHALTNRPLVLSSVNVVKMELLSDTREAVLTVDGQVNIELLPLDVVVVERFDHDFQLVQPKDAHFFDTLRDRFNWGGQVNYASH